MYIKLFSGSVVGLTALILISVVAFNTVTNTSRQAPAKLVSQFDFVPFNMEIVNRFAASIRFKTISHDDTSGAVEHEELLGLHAHIYRSFPQVHRHLSLDIIANHSLVYTWKGSNPDLKGVLLCAHLDVVPANEEDGWTVPPFEGRIQDEHVWGRGAIDDKHMVFGILEAVENLLARGFQPKRTVYLGFGHDEEVGGFKGAHHIGQFFTERKIQLDWLLDEGLLIVEDQLPGISGPVALIGTEEKGNMIVRLKHDILTFFTWLGLHFAPPRAQGMPGHGSIPPKVSTIGRLAKAIVAIEEHPMASQLSLSTRALFDYISPEMKLPMRTVLSNLWLFEKLIVWVLNRSPATSASISTTRSISMAQAGVKANVVASEAIAYIDIRIAPHHTIQQVEDDLRHLVSPFNVTVEHAVPPLEPSPKASASSEGFALIASSVRKLYPNVPVAPALMIGNTDTRHYWDLTPNIYRFNAIHATPEDVKLLHGVNERISFDNYFKLINFYVQLIHEL